MFFSAFVFFGQLDSHFQIFSIIEIEFKEIFVL